METRKWYEYADKRICKYWLQKEDCRKCLFDNLCTPEDKAQDKNEELIIDKVIIKKKSKPKKIIVEWNTTLKTKRRTKKADKNA